MTLVIPRSVYATRLYNYYQIVIFTGINWKARHLSAWVFWSFTSDTQANLSISSTPPSKTYYCIYLKPISWKLVFPTFFSQCKVFKSTFKAQHNQMNWYAHVMIKCNTTFLPYSILPHNNSIVNKSPISLFKTIIS